VYYVFRKTLSCRLTRRILYSIGRDSRCPEIGLWWRNGKISGHIHRWNYTQTRLSNWIYTCNLPRSLNAGGCLISGVLTFCLGNLANLKKLLNYVYYWLCRLLTRTKSLQMDPCKNHKLYLFRGAVPVLMHFEIEFLRQKCFIHFFERFFSHFRCDVSPVS
jgi:hypothetical protein